VHRTVPVHDNMSMPASSYVVRDSIDEPRTSKRCRARTSFGSEFLTTFLIEGFDVNFLADELVFAFFIEQGPKTFTKAMGSIYSSF